MDAAPEIANTHLRRATAADIGDIERLQRQTQVSVLADWQSLPDWQHRFEAKGVFSYVCEDDDVFGVVSIGPVVDGWGEEAEVRTGQVYDWFVLPAYQGRGFGRKLLVHGLSVLKRLGSERALTWIPNDSSRARVVVDRLGFELTGVERTLNVDGLARQDDAFVRDLSAYF